jgi:PTH1 family peptidyl-tRNA hydrolase
MDIICFVGLGNPGERYKNTRHNAGFDALDSIRDYFNFKDFKGFKSEVEYSSGEIVGSRAYLVKPLTYMNNSGIALKKFCDYHSIAPRDLIVIYDDIDTDTGKIKIRKKGSAGGHNGMKSVISNFQTEDIVRIRIGTGPKKEGVDLVSYVLSRYDGYERDEMKKVFAMIPEIAKIIVLKGIDIAMNIYNQKR